MGRRHTHRNLRLALKNAPEYKLRKLFDMMEIVGIEKDIAIQTWLEHKTCDEICAKENISIKTLHNHKNRILSKIEQSLVDFDLD